MTDNREEQEFRERYEFETDLLRIMSKRKTFEEHYKYLDKKRLIKQTRNLLQDFNKYFEAYSDDVIDRTKFYTQFSQNWHGTDLDNEEVEYYKEHVFPDIFDGRETPDDKSIILGLIKKTYVEKLKSLVEKDFSSTKIVEVLDSYNAKIANYETVKDPYLTELTDLSPDEITKTGGINWDIYKLQQALGAIVRGELIVFTGDTNSGKSTAMIQQASSTVKQILKDSSRGPVLYFNSEGPKTLLHARLWANLYKEHIRGGFDSILDNFEDVRDMFIQQGFNEKWKQWQLFGMTEDDVFGRIDHYQPSLVIMDMPDGLIPDKNVSNLTRMYERLRAYADNICPIITGSQAGNTTFFNSKTKQNEKEKWLDDSHVMNAKAKSHSATTLIGIGRDIDENSNNRYINIPKVKMGNAVRIHATLNKKYCEFVDIGAF